MFRELISDKVKHMIAIGALGNQSI
jgi:hypothetical protein